MSRRSWIEVGAVVLTGLLHPVFVDVLHLRALFIAAAILAWSGYFVLRLRRDSSLLTGWGFSGRGLWPSFAAVGVVFVLATGVMGVIAARNGTMTLQPDMLPLLILYPVWGLGQQFLVQGLLVRNLALQERVLPAAPTILLAALAFSVVHLPDLTLTFATFLLGLAFTPIYLRWRNLWPLGLAHGWLGVLCYFWILGRDPWSELLSHGA